MEEEMRYDLEVKVLKVTRGEITFDPEHLTGEDIATLHANIERRMKITGFSIIHGPYVDKIKITMESSVEIDPSTGEEIVK
jgi:hypothetical protein